MVYAPHTEFAMTGLDVISDSAVDRSMTPWIVHKEPVADPRAAAFDALPLPALLVDPDGTIAAGNDAVGVLAGVQPGALTGCPWWTLLSPVNTTATEEPDGARRYVLHGAGADRQVTVRTRPLGSGVAAPLLVLLDPCAPDSGASGEADTLFLLDVAHELRSPLFSFNLALSSLNEHGHLLMAEDMRLLQSLRRSAVHVQTLVENMLDAASIGARRFSVRLNDVDLRVVVDEALLVVEPLLVPHGQTVVVEFAQETLPIEADPQRLRQVLVNLLHNAIKYGPRNETITVRATQHDDTVTVEVVDRGMGIPEDERAQLFDRFFRGHAARSTGQGSGLGLAIARAIVEAHGGEIGVHSAAGAGTTFWFTMRHHVAHSHSGR